jgi:hypothetical protein
VSDEQTSYSLSTAVLLNDFSDETVFPYSLVGRWVVDRATQSEIATFRSLFARLVQACGWVTGLPYEATITVQPDSSSAHWMPLDSGSWRYTVVRGTARDEDDRRKLDEALRISPDDLRIAGWMRWEEGWGSVGNIFKVPDCFQWIWHIFDNYAALTPRTPDLNRVNEIYDLRSGLDEQRFPQIARALALFTELDELTDSSNAKFLGYFSVIESLLSHDPDRYDPVDSITRQLKRNLTLLDHRMPPSENLEFSEFQNATREQIVGKLYGIRSAVAHGGDISGDVQWLNARRPPGSAVFDIYI